MDNLLNQLTGSQWCNLLITQPHMDTQCQWFKLTADDWVRLLTYQPQFYKKCNVKFNQHQINRLLSMQPQLSHYLN